MQLLSLDDPFLIHSLHSIWQFFRWAHKVIKVGESRETTGRLGLHCAVVCLTKLPCYAGYLIHFVCLCRVLQHSATAVFLNQ